jgi:hypothetical protein
VDLARANVGGSRAVWRGLIGRFSTVAVLVLPVGLLFHRPFVTVIIVRCSRAGV